MAEPTGSHPGVHHAPADPACSWPIRAGARRHTTPRAHPGRGSAAQTSRTPSRPGFDGTQLQEPIQAEARRRTNPEAHPGRGSAAQTSRSPSNPGLDGEPIQEPIQAEARRRTYPGAHLGRGSAARTSRSTCHATFSHRCKNFANFQGHARRARAARGPLTPAPGCPKVSAMHVQGGSLCTPGHTHGEGAWSSSKMFSAGNQFQGCRKSIT